MKTVATLSLLALSLGAAQAQSLDCAALANSAGIEPAGYAEQCLAGVVPSPQAFPSPRAPTDTAFTIDIRGQAPRPANTLYSFVLNAFATQTARGATQPSTFGMDFNPAGTTLYAGTGSAAAPNPSSFGTVNTTTGAFTLIGPITGLGAGESLTDLVINPSTGAAFVSAAATATNLYSFNLTTGAATLIGPMGTGLFIDLAINCQGQMYAHNITDDSLYSVNTATGAGTLIGAHGLAANFAQGMDFDAQDGTLYGFIYTGGGTNRFGTFNLATGAFTTLVQDNPLGEYEGAIPTTCAPPSADVSITKTGPGGSVVVGSPLTYSLTVANAGPGGATGVVVTDPLPAQVTYVSNTCGATFAAGTLTWTIGALANAANATCSVTTTVNATGTISNTATVATTTTDPATGNNSSTATVTGAPATADVSITKTGPGGTVTVGSPLTFTLVAANAGPDGATGVVVTDVLPAQVTYVSNTCGATVAGSTLTWTVGALASAANATCSVTTTVNAAGTISNTATVASTSTDPAAGNNSSTATVNGAPATADLSLTKTATPPATFAIGASITYTLTVSNAGPSGATGVVVTDPLPANTTYVSNTCGATAAANTVTWTVGTLAAAASATCSITVTISATGSIRNTATASSTSTDTVPANNAATAVLGGVAPVVTAVPATSWTTLLLFAIGVLTLGLLVQRRA